MRSDPAIPDEAEALVDLAKEDLARREGLSAGGIAPVRVEAVQWSDASLGCPQPGMAYAQVITAGFRIVLRAGRRRYEYHSDRRRVVLAERVE